MTIVVAHLDAVERQVRVLPQKRSSEEESTAETFKLSGDDTALVSWISLFKLLREVHRIVDVAHISERAFEQILSSVNPSLAVHACVRAHLVVRSRDSKRLVNLVCRSGNLCKSHSASERHNGNKNAFDSLFHVFVHLIVCSQSPKLQFFLISKHKNRHYRK